MLGAALRGIDAAKAGVFVIAWLTIGSDEMMGVADIDGPLTWTLTPGPKAAISSAFGVTVFQTGAAGGATIGCAAFAAACCKAACCAAAD